MMGHYLNWGSIFPDDLIFFQADKNYAAQQVIHLGILSYQGP